MRLDKELLRKDLDQARELSWLDRQYRCLLSAKDQEIDKLQQENSTI